MADNGSGESSQPVDLPYATACLLGVPVIVIGPWVWYANMWLGSGQGDDLSLVQRILGNGPTFTAVLFATWLFLTWRVSVRVRRGRRVDGGLALVILGAIELVVVVGVLALFSP